MTTTQQCSRNGCINAQESVVWPQLRQTIRSVSYNEDYVQSPSKPFREPRELATVKLLLDCIYAATMQEGGFGLHLHISMHRALFSERAHLLGEQRTTRAHDLAAVVPSRPLLYTLYSFLYLGATIMYIRGYSYEMLKSCLILRPEPHRVGQVREMRPTEERAQSLGPTCDASSTLMLASMETSVLHLAHSFSWLSASGLS